MAQAGTPTAQTHLQAGRRRLVTAGLMVGLLVAALDQTIVDTAFPRMIADLGGVAIFTWVITAYLLSSTAIVPVVGKLADIYGRKFFYLAGMVLFVGGSALCGAAQTMTQLILFRAVQGIGAGMLMPIAFTIVGDLYPGAERAKMQGLFAGTWGLASIIGPKLGGWLTHNLSWRWVFYVNLPIGVVAAALIYLYYRESRGQRRPIDWTGSITITAGIVLFLLALVQGGNEWAWGSWQSLLLFAGAAVLLSLFVWVETRAPEPVLDLNLFQDRTFSVMVLVGLLMGAGLFGSILFVPWFIQGVVGVDPNQAGNVMTPMMMTTVTFAMLAGRLALRFPYRYQISAGFTLVATGFWLMTGWTVNTTLLTATLCSMVVGAGMGLIMPVMTFAVQNAFPARQRGVVTSATTFFRQIGATVGVTVFGVIFNAQMTRHFQDALGPRLQQAGPMLASLPPGVRDALGQLLEKPQSLVQMLLRPEATSGIPAAVLAPILTDVKVMMATSLHVVFWTGMGIVLFGLLAAQLLGTISLRGQLSAAGDGEPARVPAGGQAARPMTEAPVLGE